MARPSRYSPEVRERSVKPVIDQPDKLAALVLSALTLAGAACASSGRAEPFVWPRESWETGSPESQGMDSAELAAMLERLAENNPGIRSVSVIRSGTLVLDARVAPFPADGRQLVYSCTKSVLSALVGIAVAEDELAGVDARVLDLHPSSAAAGTEDAKRALRLEHLLTMSTGLETEDNWLHGWRGLSAMRRSEDWPGYVLSRALIAQPGERFEYSNGVSHLLGVVPQEAVGETAHDYARERLFDPLGIGDTDWELDNEGRNLGYAGLRIHPLDLARIGYLYLRGGEWDGERVLSADWVEASLSARIEAGTLAEGYGYQWWIHEDGVKAMYGHAGQCVFLVPEHDLVVVFVSAMPSRYFFTPLRLLHEYVIPAVRSRDVLRERPSNLARLEAAKAVLGTQEREHARPLPAAAQAASGRRYAFAPNASGLRALTPRFDPGGAEVTLVLDYGGVVMEIPVGLDGTFRYSKQRGEPWAFRARWEDDATLFIEQELLSRANRRRTTLRLHEDGLDFESIELVDGHEESLRATLAD